MFPFSKMSGLTELAGHYPALDAPEGLVLRKQTVKVGAVVFKRCATVGIGSRGLHLQVKHLFGKYPPVLIPWGDVASVEPTRLYWQPAASMTIGTPHRATLTVQMDLFEKLSSCLPSSLPANRL